uniref:Pleckstrin homology domain-containing family M member 2 n=1 Tax=Denticeps clupeoides TaxID=299321 RepID=A0AAY4BCN7_9TELE
HDRVLQRLCEHLDHALLYGLQDISSGYWVLVLHFTRREAIKQIDELQHIATNLGRSRAWLYLALSESSLESYLRLFQENQGLLQKYYFKNALVCSHDHLTLFLTLVSGLEFIRFDLELDVPYLDVAPYMPEYYKPQNVLDFEERLPSSDSLSLHSFISLTSNLEWDDSAIAPSSEDYDFGDIFPVLQSVPNADWEDPQTVVGEAAAVVVRASGVSVRTASLSHSPTFRHNPFNEDSDTNTSADVTPVHTASWNDCTTGDDTESTSTELEVIRIGKENGVDAENSSWSPEETHDGPAAEMMGNKKQENGDEEDARTVLRLPEMTDTSMDSVGQPLRDVMDRLNGECDISTSVALPSQQQPFREDSAGEPPDPEFQPCSASPGFLQSPPAPTDFYCFTPQSPEPAATGGGHHDTTGHYQSPSVPGGHEDQGEGEAEAERPSGQLCLKEEEAECQPVIENGPSFNEREAEPHSPSEMSHPAEFKVDNNHLLLLMIHVFRENEEQLFKMLRMSTGHMEGDLQPLYLLLTDCYVYLLRKGAAEKPYTVEEAVSYNELDYVSVGLDQQTVTLVCTNRRRQFLLDTADSSLTDWFLAILKSAMVNGCREPPYPSVLTDATMEKLALTKFVCQESHCEVSEVSINLYSLVHWEDPMDVNVCSLSAPIGLGETSSGSSKEGHLLYRAGTTYLGKELWKSCYLLLSNGILYQYAERTDLKPLVSITMGGEHCGGCRRSNSTERPHAFHVILNERPPLELSAENEQEMADWMQLLCQSVSKGVVPHGMAPTQCISCCLVVTNKKLLTCHQDCQTSFFRSLGGAELRDVTAVCLEEDREYCMIEFSTDRDRLLPPWVLYFSGCEERNRMLVALESAWKNIYQVCLPRKCVLDPSLQKRCGEALALIQSAWQRSDSIHRGRSQREPWC